ncbi:iron permease FTR1 family-domain-containing protein [Blastocladiella britannica]|nr:iron permease FTR1 family-domain-containing protein [Blastocladiella britannica]
MAETGITVSYGVPDSSVQNVFVTDDGWFNVPAYFVFAREVLEMAVVLAVLITFINRLLANEPQLRARMVRQVIFGALSGFVLCLAVAVGFIVAFQVFRVDVWGSGHFEQLWQGIFKTVALVMITFLCFTMVKAEYWQLKWEHKLRSAARAALGDCTAASADAAGLHGARQRWAMFILPFTVVVREGLEALLLLGGTAASASAKSIVIPAVTGSATGLAIGWLVWRGGQSMVLKRYLQISTVFLLFVAAGLASGAVHEFEEMADAELVLVDIQGDQYDGESGNWFFTLIGSLFGWRPKWTLGTTLAYFGYWVVCIPLLWAFWRRQSRAADRLAVDAAAISHEEDDFLPRNDVDTVDADRGELRHLRRKSAGDIELLATASDSAAGSNSTADSALLHSKDGDDEDDDEDEDVDVKKKEQRRMADMA